MALLGALALVPAQAAALTLPAVTSADASACGQASAFAPAAAPLPAAGITITKSDAILGGAESALERIRREQSGLKMPAALKIAQGSSGGSLFGLALPCSSATQLMMPLPAPQVPLAAARDAREDSFLATQRIAVRQTSFSGQWARVSEAKLSEVQMPAPMQVEVSSGAARLQAINRWVNRNITYAEDRELWGKNDYWASAEETLRMGKGDCEDIAILKYQILIALGVDERDMFLTLARDLARNADHAVLVVREGNRFFLLDNSVDAILPANVSYDYRPTLSFNSESAWLHGATARPAESQLAYLSVNATSSPRVIGLSR